MKKNKIRDISKLEEFVNKLQKLEKIVLSENRIDKRRYGKILSKIQKKIKLDI